ncbi:hypothetical protein OGAPHI_005809 [Ogataea philodendri]|uniref:Uncharacterized protein n=1 Tax=Ogataea philodendri TaxID=1378263 RepID=A0A9P8NZU8_9ASCO|nr:uncharacterized protein OGAPHI_005809 [Ogataea philodendri]KAH3662557.1 hypothetical protein OGAPHI_005809 [Ogataea philodendri]
MNKGEDSLTLVRQIRNFASRTNPSSSKPQLAHRNGSPDEECRHSRNTHKVAISGLGTTTHRKQRQEPKQMERHSCHIGNSTSVDSSEEVREGNQFLVRHVDNGPCADVDCRVDGTERDDDNERIHQVWRVVWSTDTKTQSDSQINVKDTHQGLSDGNRNSSDRVFGFCSVQGHQLNTTVSGRTVDNRIG